MIKLHFGRFLKIPFRLRQRVVFLDDNNVLNDGVIENMDVIFLDGGKAVDIDFIVHPIIDKNEINTVEFFSDYEINERIFASKRKGKKSVNERNAQKKRPNIRTKT